MAKPTQLKKREEEAERLHRQLYGQDTSDQEAPANQEDGAQASGQESDQAADAGQQHDQGSDQQTEGLQEQQTHQPASHQENWEEKYRVLKGKYDSEVPRMAQQLREKDQQLQDLTKRLENLESQQQQQPQQSTTTDDSELERYREQFGDDLLEVIDRVSERKARNMVDQAVNERVQPLQQDVERQKQQAVQTAQQQFEATLAELVPDWQDVNSQQEWLSWLSEVDEFTGRTRQELLDEAAQNLDANRVAAFFKRFKDTASPRAQREQEQRRHVAPPADKGSEPPSRGPQYTHADWQKLQSDIQRGKYKGREQEARDKEREIHAALFG